MYAGSAGEAARDAQTSVLGSGLMAAYGLRDPEESAALELCLR